MISINLIEYLDGKPKSFIRAMGFAFVGLTGLLDYVTGPEIAFSIFYLIPVSLVAWFSDRRTGIFVSVLSAVVWFTADVLSSRTYSHAYIPFWNASVRFSFFFLFALTLCALRNALVRHMERDIEIAREIQQRLLPSLIPTWPNVEVAVRLVPARRLSGDYYDFFQSPQSLGILVADVAGKGLPASLVMANLHAVFHSVHTLIGESEDVSAILGTVNRHLVAHTAENQFVTLFLAALSADGRKLTCAGAGSPPVILSYGAETCLIHAAGPPVGICPDAVWPVQRFDLGSTGTLVIFTDGIFEATNARGAPYGLNRIIQNVSSLSKTTRTAQEVVEGLISDLNVWTANGNINKDDMLLVVVRRVPFSSIAEAQTSETHDLRPGRTSSPKDPPFAPS